MQNRHMHDGARVAAIVAFFTLVDIEMDKHRTPPLPLAEDIFDISNSRST